MTCYDCIHCEPCSDIDGGFSAHRSDVSKCKHFKPKSRFIELPCAVGDTVYMPWEFAGAEGVAILTVTHIIFDGLHVYIKTDLISDCDEYLIAYNNGRFGFAEFGKTVFIAKEEAEKALKEKRR